MKPNFALSLSYEGVELLQRVPGGWQPVGAVAFDRPDLDAAIDALRAEAQRLAPEGVKTKLIVPESEVRYATVLAPGPTDEARRYQIEAEIEGLTPYGTDDLAYDWVVEGDHAQVAIVARETLREAEDFAAERGFNPVSFVALPEGGQFLGEPFFGQTGAAQALLPAGAVVQPDSEAVRRIARGSRAAAPAKPAPTSPATPAPAAPPTAAASGPVSAAAPAVSPVAKSPAPVAPVASVKPQAPVAPRPPAPQAPAPEAQRPQMPAVAAEATRKVGDLVRKVGTRLRREQVEAETAAPQALARDAQDLNQTESQSAAAVVAFSSRRAAGGGGPVRGIPMPSPTEPTRPGASPGGRLAILPKGGSGRGAAEGLSNLTRAGRGAMQKALSRLSMRPGKASAPAPARAESTGAARFETAPNRPAPTEPLIPASRPPTTEREKASEAQAMTLFGQRGMVQAQPRALGPVLMAAGGVTAILAAVAVWALYFSGPGEVAQAPSAPAQVEPAPGPTAALAPPAPIEAPARLPDPPAPVAAVPALDTAPVPEAAAPVTEPAPAAQTETAVAQEPAPAADPAALVDRLAQEALAEVAPAEVIDRLAPSGAQPAEPVADAPSRAAAPSAGPAEVAAGAGLLALPGRLAVPPTQEVAPISLAPPPPPTAIATALPVVTGETAPAATAPVPAAPAEPDVTINVTAGRPAAVPPPAPGRPAPPPAAAAPVVPDDTPRADPALAGARPVARSDRVRALGEALRAAQPVATDPPPPPEPAGRLDQGAAPASLVAPVTATAAAETAAPPPGGVALALLRPLRRPTDLVPPPAPEAPAPAAEDLPPEIVDRSLVPAARPRALAARVEAALAAQRERPAAPARAVAPAAATPGEDEEPAEVATAAPRIPTSASVQREATQRRAIRTRDANLIGVFGAPSNRRALVRMPNGDVVRLQVGDRFDGGEVSAIGDSELRYVRGGRDRVLRIASRS